MTDAEIKAIADAWSIMESASRGAALNAGKIQIPKLCADLFTAKEAIRRLLNPKMVLVGDEQWVVDPGQCETDRENARAALGEKP